MLQKGIFNSNYTGLTEDYNLSCSHLTGSGNYMSLVLTLKGTAFRPEKEFVSFLWFSESTVVTFLNVISRINFITDKWQLFCDVRSNIYI
jgi:hypothetical protein